MVILLKDIFFHLLVLKLILLELLVTDSCFVKFLLMMHHAEQVTKTFF